MKSSSEHTKGILALILLALVFASMGIFARYLGTDFHVFQQLYLRIFAAFVLGTILFSKNLSISKLRSLPSKDWIVIIVRAVSLYIIAIPLSISAFLSAKYSSISFIGALPTTAVLAFILFHEKITWQKVSLILLGFVGVVLLSITDYRHIFTWDRGDLFAFIADFFFSLGYIARKWQSNTLNNKESTILIFFISTVLLVITSFAAGEHLLSLAKFSPAIIAVILIAGIFNVANLFLVNYGFQRVEGVLASNVLMLESFFGLLLSIVLFREVPNVKELFGGILIVCSAYQMNKLEG